MAVHRPLSYVNRHAAANTCTILLVRHNKNLQTVTNWSEEDTRYYAHQKSTMLQ